MRNTRTISLALIGLALACPPALALGPCPPEWTPAFEVDSALYPFTHHCFEHPLGTVHYLDESPGDPRGTVLMLHGNPTWSFLYRNIAPALVDLGYRVIAPDYFGFGLSDKPELSMFGYTPADHADIVDALVTELALSDTIFVLQDWGGPIGIDIAGRHRQQVRGLVLMNTFTQRLSVMDPGATHLAVDFSLENILLEESIRASGDFPHDVGLAMGFLNPRNFDAVRDAYWAPFLELPGGEPLSPDIVAPTNIFAQNLLLGAGFLESVDVTLTQSLTDLPMFILWGSNDRMWGTLKCDADAVPVCPDGTTCEVVGAESLCLDEDGEPVFHQVDHLAAIWQRGGIVGRVITPNGVHFVQETDPAAVVRAVVHVDRAADAGRPAKRSDRHQRPIE